MNTFSVPEIPCDYFNSMLNWRPGKTITVSAGNFMTDAAKKAQTVTTPELCYRVKRIQKNGPATIVFWQDGTKTIVKRSPDEPDNDYAAFTAALGIKVYGSNSALKRIVYKTEPQKPKKQKGAEREESDFTLDMLSGMFHDALKRLDKAIEAVTPTEPPTSGTVDSESDRT